MENKRRRGRALGLRLQTVPREDLFGGDPRPASRQPSNSNPKSNSNPNSSSNPNEAAVATNTTREVSDAADLEKVEILGYGAGGKVYKVRHWRTQSLYALKIVHGNHDRSTKRQILREMDILRRTDSPYVVKCHGVFYHGGEIQFVMEYMDMDSLDKRPTPRLPEPFLAEVARQVLHGLKYLHSQKIVHRNIKPSNLLLNSERQVKIADFCLSRILSRTLDPWHSYVGTFAYTSPERFDPDENDGQSDGYAGDIWSLGLTLLECYIGKFPFSSSGSQLDWPSLVSAICLGEPPLPPPSASAEFQSFIRCCLKKDAAQRWTAAMLLSHPFISRSAPPLKRMPSALASPSTHSHSHL